MISEGTLKLNAKLIDNVHSVPQFRSMMNIFNDFANFSKLLQFKTARNVDCIVLFILIYSSLN